MIFIGTLASMALGVAFQSYVASRIGTSRVADAFYLGMTLPTLIATVMIGTASNALMRLAVERGSLLRVRHAGPGRSLLFGGAALSLLMAISGAVAAAAGHEPANSVSGLVLATSPVPLLAVIAGLGAVGNFARGHVIRGTWGGAINGLGLLVTALIIGRNGLSLGELAAAVDVGYVLQALVVGLILFRPGKTEPSAAAAQAALRGFLVLAAASCVYKSQPVVERITGTVIGAGVPAALGYADKITSGLVLLAAFGFSSAALPRLSRALAAGVTIDARERLAAALTATSITTAAVAAFTAVSAGDIVSLLFEHGAFDAASASVTRGLILCAIPTIVFGALAGPITSMAYAAGFVATVARVGLLGFVVGTASTAALAATIGYRGIVLGTGCGTMVTFGLFVARAGKFLPGWRWSWYLIHERARLLASGTAALGAAVLGRLVLSADAHTASTLAVALVGRFLFIAIAAGWAAFAFRRSPVVKAQHA